MTERLKGGILTRMYLPQTSNDAVKVYAFTIGFKKMLALDLNYICTEPRESIESKVINDYWFIDDFSKCKL